MDGIGGVWDFEEFWVLLDKEGEGLPQGLDLLERLGFLKLELYYFPAVTAVSQAAESDARFNRDRASQEVSDAVYVCILFEFGEDSPF